MFSLNWKLKHLFFVKGCVITCAKYSAIIFFYFCRRRWTTTDVSYDLRILPTKACLWITCQTSRLIPVLWLWKVTNVSHWVKKTFTDTLMNFCGLLSNYILGRHFWAPWLLPNITMPLILEPWYKALKGKAAVICIPCVLFQGKTFNKLPEKFHWDDKIYL